MTVRTRFAPSPTGFIHLGNIRSALFPWAFARHFGGTFILRIEDTDTERSTPEATQAIIDAMQWLGLGYDEGPTLQSQRTDRYREVVESMLARGLAYRDYTTPAELEALREAQIARGEKPRYDGRWRPERAMGATPPKDVLPAIRFRNPDEKSVVWEDAVKGRIEIANDELDDLVIARSDGAPTYNFCVVVDDIDMRITHVIRGDDHVNNTPRQINIMHALGATPPVYGHLPTVLTPEGDKLSKRHGARGVLQYRDDGYLPEAIVNYLARLGWSHGDAEIFSRDELVRWFNGEGLSTSAGRFDPDKLRWVNHEHIKRMPADELGASLAPFLERAGVDVTTGPDIAPIADLLRDRAATLVEMADAARYFYITVSASPELVDKHVDARTRPALTDLFAASESHAWTREAIAALLKETAVRHGLKPPQLMMATRVLVAGTTQTPAIDAVLALLGREVVRARLMRALMG